MNQKLMTIKDVKRHLCVGRDWVYARIRSGELPYLKMGHYVRFYAKDVERLIEKNHKNKERDHGRSSS